MSGSAPRPPGAKLAASGSGGVCGAVSGGCVEGAVVNAAAEVLRGSAPRLLQFGIADTEAWEVGLPCGGEIEVFVEGVQRVGAQAGFARAAAEDSRAALVTIVAGHTAPVGAKLLVWPDGSCEGELADERLERSACELSLELMWAERPELREVGDVRLFIDVTAPAPRLVAFGAIDYTAALCRLARAVGWRPFVCDPRSRFAAPERFPEAEQVVPAWPEQAIERIGGLDRATYVAVLTHDPKLDDAALIAALRSEAAYVGAMGSRRANASRRERLLAAGLDEQLLERLSAPIGLDLGAHSAEETALSIMAEVVAARNGREGGRLTRAVGAIHAVGA